MVCWMVCLSGNGEVDGVRERDGCAVFAVGSVAGRAVLFIESGEVEDLFRAYDFGARSGAAVDAAAPGGGNTGSR